MLAAAHRLGALNAARQQRIALQTELVERRIAIVTARHLEREQILSTLRVPTAPFTGHYANQLAIHRRYSQGIMHDGARDTILMLSAAISWFCIINEAIAREWSEQQILDYHGKVEEFSSDVYADLNTLQLLNFELEFWMVLADEPHWTFCDLCYPSRDTSIARYIEHETWGWEDGNLSHVVDNRMQRYDICRRRAERYLRDQKDGIPSESLRDLSDLLTCIEQAIAALRDRASRLRILRGDAL